MGDQRGLEYNGHSEILFERLLRFRAFLFDEVCVSVVTGYLRRYRRWDGTRGKNLDEQKELVNQVVDELEGHREGRSRAGRQCKYLVEKANGEETGWPELREAIFRATDYGDPELLVVIPTLDGVQFNLSFLELLADPKCDQMSICVKSGWRRVRTLAQDTNYKHMSQYDFWYFEDGCSFTDFEDMVKRVHQRNKGLPYFVKEGMREAAQRGIRLGSQCRGTHQFTKDERIEGGRETALQRQIAAREYYQRWVGDICSWRRRGLSLGQIAKKLNARGAKTLFDGPFSRMAVSRILKRLSNPLA